MSATIRTARSRSSAGYRLCDAFLFVDMCSILSKEWSLHQTQGSSRTLHTVVPRVPRQASDAAYEVVADVAGLDLLLIDDTFTTGASIQSAASALQLAGANVVGAVVVGRVINPEFTPETKALWAKARGLPFRFATCCVSSP